MMVNGEVHSFADNIRVRLPKDMNSMFPTKLLISTGPKYGDVGCTEKADIEVEMVPPGKNGLAGDGDGR